MRAVERIARHGWAPRLDELSRAAGEAIMQVYARQDVGERAKADESPVTEADLAAHRVLAAGLARLAADVPVISEESFDGDEARAAQIVRARGTFWLVDPLDGTRDFLARSGEFTVNVALMENGRPVAGWLYVPVQRVLYKAISGEGAFRVQGDDAPVRIETRGCDANAPVVLVSRSHGRGEAAALQARMPAAKIEAVGSSLKYMRIAEGSADATVRRSPTRVWDTAAADAILGEAGGRILGYEGHRLDYTREDLTNPPFLAVGDPQFDGLKRFGFLVGRE